jgi:dihydrofolate synthase/folylpolyglutamate synthase
MVFGVVADKDLDSIVEYLPKEAYYWFVNAKGTRALPAQQLAQKMKGYGFTGEAVTTDIASFLKGFTPAKEDFVFIGGSTFVVAEALE